MDAKLKHLEFIQGVINRLATASFRMKGWAVVLVSALLFFLARGGNIDAAWIGLLSIVVFWGLDGYYLRQERLFRNLYDHVRNLHSLEIDFSMDTREFKQRWLCAVFSCTLIPFYIVLVFVIVLVLALSAGTTACVNQQP